MMMGKRNKYGRCDWARFDNRAPSLISAGKGKIGEVKVQCKFNFTESKWGVLGSSKGQLGESTYPGGILYLDLSFEQPVDCRLQSATVTVTLEGDKEASSDPVHFTDHYGPKDLRGEPTQMLKRKTKNRTPFLEVLGYGAGGLGNDSEKIVNMTNRWSFSGSLDTTDNSRWYNRLEWTLVENKVDNQSMPCNEFHTAFALGHNGKKFLMNVEVRGTLEHKLDRLLNRVMKFRGKGSHGTITTKFEWTDEYASELHLDRIAHNLADEMVRKNMSRRPVQVPDTLPVGYPSAMPGQVPQTVNNPPALANPQALLGHDETVWSMPSQQATIRPALLDIGSLIQALPDQTNENIILAAGIITRPPTTPRCTSQASEWSFNETTLAAESQPEEIVNEGVSLSPKSTAPDIGLHKESQKEAPVFAEHKAEAPLRAETEGKGTKNHEKKSTILAGMLKKDTGLGEVDLSWVIQWLLQSTVLGLFAVFFGFQPNLGPGKATEMDDEENVEGIKGKHATSNSQGDKLEFVPKREVLAKTKPGQQPLLSGAGSQMQGKMDEDQIKMFQRSYAESSFTTRTW